MTDSALGVDEVEGGPVVIVERLPHGVVVVDGDGIADVHRLEGDPHPVEVFLEVELGCLHADDGQPVVRVLVGPGPHEGKGANPVDAGVGTEADQDDPFV